MSFSNNAMMLGSRSFSGDQIFSSYTEVDPSAHLTVTSTSITAAAMGRNEAAYVYKDCGVNYWNGTITILGQINMTAAGSVVSGLLYFGGMGNSVGGFVDSSDALSAYGDFSNVGSGFIRFFLTERDGGVQYSSTAIPSAAQLSSGTNYYTKLVRTTTGGASGVGQATLSVYSDSGRTTHVNNSPQTIDLHTSVKSFRYMYGVQGRNDGATPFGISGVFSNMNATKV